MKNIVVLKCGGSTIETLSDEFFQSIKELKDTGHAPVIVHGGGPAIKRMLALLHVESEFINGLRKTNEQVMHVVEMVLSGTVNKTLVRRLTMAGLDAVGLSGCDNRLIEAVPLDKERFGLVGEVSKVNCKLIFDLLERDIVPVIAPIGFHPSGKIYNINADTAAGAVSKALKAEKLLFVTDVAGILKNGELLENVTETEVRDLIKNGTIYGGMIPKVEAALKSLQDPLDEVMITAANAKIIKDRKMAGTAIQKRERVTVNG